MISIIVPFYNVEQYIKKCIESIKSQTYTDFECLLIDDGSVDNSYSNALESIQGDSRFRIIQQENKGQGGARNRGLDLARGEYISFVDSDDFLDLTFLEKLLATLLSEGADIVGCPLRRLSADGQLILQEKIKQDAIVDQEAIFDYLVINPSPCNKLYSRSAWEGIRFPEGRYYEDLATLHRLSQKVSKIVETDEVSYNYLFFRAKSTMNTFSTRHFIDWKKAIKSIDEAIGGKYFSRQEIAYRLVRLVVRSGNQEEYRQLISSDMLSPLDYFNSILKWKNIWQLKYILTYQILPIKVFNRLIEKGWISIH